MEMRNVSAFRWIRYRSLRTTVSKNKWKWQRWDFDEAIKQKKKVMEVNTREEVMKIYLLLWQQKCCTDVKRGNNSVGTSGTLYHMYTHISSSNLNTSLALQTNFGTKSSKTNAKCCETPWWFFFAASFGRMQVPGRNQTRQSGEQAASEREGERRGKYVDYKTRCATSAFYQFFQNNHYACVETWEKRRHDPEAWQKSLKFKNRTNKMAASVPGLICVVQSRVTSALRNCPLPYRAIRWKDKKKINFTERGKVAVWQKWWRRVLPVPDGQPRHNWQDSERLYQRERAPVNYIFERRRNESETRAGRVRMCVDHRWKLFQPQFLRNYNCKSVSVRWNPRTAPDIGLSPGKKKEKWPTCLNGAGRQLPLFTRGAFYIISWREQSAQVGLSDWQISLKYSGI